MKINFTINSFSDALILADEHGFSDVEIEAMKQARYDSWQAVVNTAASEEVVQVVEE